ncbi:MAG: PAS domain-containing protein [Nitriliruptoraceae bacterium]
MGDGDLDRSARALFDHHPDAIGRFAPDGSLLEINQSFAERSQVAPTELAGLSYRSFMPSEQLPALDERFQRAVQGEAQYVETTLSPPGATAFPARVILVPDVGPDGTARAVFAIVRDLTEERAAAEQLASADWLRRAAGRVARLGGWSVEVPSYEVSWSDEVYELVGVSPTTELSPRSALSYYTPESRREVVAAIERCATDGIPFDLEATAHRDDGTRVDVRVAGEAQRDADGSIHRIIGTFQDITPLKQAAEGRRRAADQLASLLRTIADGVLTCDHEWRVTYLNPAAERLMRVERSQLLGRSLWQTLPELAGSRVEQACRRAVATGELSEARRYHSQSTAAWYDIEVAPTGTGLTLVFRDVSAQVREEDRLKEAVTAEANAAEELRTVDRAKNAFIAAVSHELRTPLTVVRGMADTLVRLRERPDEATRKRVEDALVANAERLGKLLDDLLDTDRLVRGALRAERSEMELIGVVSALVAEAGDAQRIVLRAPERLEVSADPVLVERSVRNLLENAAKYAPVGPIEVVVEAVGAGGFRLAVQDEGPGIPADDAERIFEPFHRLSDHPQPGTGVGLSLVREFARLHGGRAYADTSVERGARIVVEVPGEDEAGATG